MGGARPRRQAGHRIGVRRRVTSMARLGTASRVPLVALVNRNAAVSSDADDDAAIAKRDHAGSGLGEEAIERLWIDNVEERWHRLDACVRHCGDGFDHRRADRVTPAVRFDEFGGDGVGSSASHC